MVIKEICLASIDTAVTMVDHVRQKNFFIPVKCSLVADQKKFKRVEVLYSP